MIKPMRIPAAAAALLAAATLAAGAPLGFRGTTAPAVIAASDAAWTVTPSGLVVRTGTSNRWPGITVALPGPARDVSASRDAVVAVRNLDDAPLEICARLAGPGRTGGTVRLNAKARLAPRDEGVLRLRLHKTQIHLDAPLELRGMRTAPGETSENIDPARLESLIVFVTAPTTNHVFAVDSFRGEGAVAPLKADGFLPFIDAFGQARHIEWPGKIRNAADLAARAAAEAADLAAHPGPGGRNAWGGWADGPQLASNGFFRVEKHEGRWWLVDPDGRLFWSHGVTCVRAESATPITGREPYFAWLPPADDPLAAFYGAGSWAPHGYYEGRGTYRTFDFSCANLRRKYGEGFAAAQADLAHRRLRSWGMNTVANWSAGDILRLRRTPYTATLSPHSAPIEGSEGYWGKFPDPFHPEFRTAMRRAAEGERGRSAGDPWCLGFFVHNELGWGDATSLAAAALRSPEAQPAKQKCVEWLRASYGDIAALNAAWGAEHASWEALMAFAQAPAEAAARGDLDKLYGLIAREYFRVIREELKKVAPRQLYLGCRFAWANPVAVRAAAEYCDVIGFNAYRDTLADWSLPDGADRPVLIGEFHFGALDRGLFHTGLRPTESQAARAEAYRRYVTSALRHPNIVGAHWFQYRDQPATGRGDGENYQIGLVDICDTPYPETIRAVREMGESLYRIRSSSR
jgi:hypothetical protein